MAEPTLDEIEAEHGFRFGVPDDEPKPPAATRSLICRDPKCSNSGAHVAVHTDTAQPVICGGAIIEADSIRPCGAILLCDHVTDTTERTAGTLGAPVKITTTACTKCGTVTARTEEPQPPVDLASLPVSILDVLADTGDGSATA